MVSIRQTKMLCANIPRNLVFIRLFMDNSLFIFGRKTISLIKEW
jgi:hypothetical protein